MEAHANSVDDVLVGPLSYKLKNSANYVVDRRSVTFHPSGSNVYKTSSGTKVCKLVLTGDAWLVPETVRLMFTLKNNAASGEFVRPLGGPGSFFRRMRVLCGGQVVEDFDYARTEAMVHILHSEAQRSNDDIEGFGYRWDDLSNGGVAQTSSLPGVDGDSHIRVSFKPLCGLFSQPKWLPIRYCPITIELELVNQSTDAVVAPVAGTNFLATNTSTDWQLEDVALKADLCTLDNAVDNQIADHLLSGKALPINYQTYISQSQVVSGPSPTVNVSRAVSRLSTVFVSFEPPAAFYTQATRPRAKAFNTFYHPMAFGVAENAKVAHDPAKELEFQLQVGSKLFPEYPVQSLSEAFAQLRKTVKDGRSDFHGLSLTPQQYRKDHFIAALQTSKVSEAGFTGLNTRSGDLMTIKVKSSVPDAEMPSAMHVVLESDQILEIRDTGVQVFD